MDQEEQVCSYPKITVENGIVRKELQPYMWSEDLEICPILVYPEYITVKLDK